MMLPFGADVQIDGSISMGAFITLWTIRLSLLLFFGTIAGWILAGRSRLESWRLKVCWTLGFVLFVAHVCAAFHFYHHWSHSAAFLDTATKTRKVIGIEFGGGLYFNYLFIVIWLLDLIGLWIGLVKLPTQMNSFRFLWIGYLVFIAINSTAVFEVGWTRVAGITGIVLLVGATVIRFRRLREERLGKR